MEQQQKVGTVLLSLQSQRLLMHVIQAMLNNASTPGWFFLPGICALLQLQQFRLHQLCMWPASAIGACQLQSNVYVFSRSLEPAWATWQ